jgi:uncharacterized protein (TIGR03067 family)
MRKYGLFIALGALALILAPAPQPRSRPATDRSELDRLKGEWIRQRMFLGSSTAQPEKPGSVTVTFRDNHMTYTREGAFSSEWLIFLDASKQPGWLDRKGIAGKAKDHGFRGIYTLKGDVLTICSRMDGDRPLDFNSAKPGVLLEVLKRRGR